MSTHTYVRTHVRGPAAVAVSAGALAALACTLAPPARAAGPSTTERCAVLSPGAAPAARQAVWEACAAQGTPYSYGGGHGARPGPSTGHPNANPLSRSATYTVGFDCSGLVRWAWAQALGRDVIGPADTDTYFDQALAEGLPHIAASAGLAGLLPGDLLFYRDRGGMVHHVTMYIGAGRVVQAQRSGTEVGVSRADLGAEYAGAIRVVAAGTPGSADDWGAGLPPGWTPTVPGLGPAMVREPVATGAGQAPRRRAGTGSAGKPTAPGDSAGARKTKPRPAPGTGAGPAHGTKPAPAHGSKPGPGSSTPPAPAPTPTPPPATEPTPTPAPATPSPAPSGPLGLLNGLGSTLTGLGRIVGGGGS
ncbi:C40 family peptidase [Actinacidiphila acididurans]|uniref:C40 family peptidase n=1 Tax=Actinacidiphila acididurans TaxID=2784346 RepID=A0ABS2TTL8_9ACTN|nr:NlpC/P60 family protein [Actinacidiphila acididurans]MBM9506687.1 C40 family peptidase [Actinacidiphila acididurans]